MLDVGVGSGECVRLKTFVVEAEITGNAIRFCGVHDYLFGDVSPITKLIRTPKGYTLERPINQVGKERLLQ